MPTEVFWEAEHKAKGQDQPNRHLEDKVILRVANIPHKAVDIGAALGDRQFQRAITRGLEVVYVDPF